MIFQILQCKDKRIARHSIYSKMHIREKIPQTFQWISYY